MAIASSSYFPAPRIFSSALPLFSKKSKPSSTSKLKKISLGIASSIVQIPMSYLLGNKIIDVLKTMHINVSEEQEIIQVFNSLASCSSTFLRMSLQAALTTYVVFLGPIFEEYIFRERLYSFMKQWVRHPDHMIHRILRVFMNGFLFGIAHFSPVQGWDNIPILLVIIFIGFLYAALREITGDITASSTAHIMNNGFCAMSMFFTHR